MASGSPLSAAIRDAPAFRTYKQRFIVLGAFCLATALSAFMWICFAPIYQHASARLRADTLQINLLSACYMFSYLPGTLFATWFSRRFGLRAGLAVAGVALVLCGMLRYAGSRMGSHAYALVMAGQMCAALTQPLLLNAPARIANDWFAPSERGTATAVATMANALGNALGALLPAYVVSGPDDLPPLLLYQGVVAVIVLGVVVAGVRDMPPSPPSASARHVVAPSHSHVASPSSTIMPLPGTPRHEGTTVMPLPGTPQNAQTSAKPAGATFVTAQPSPVKMPERSSGSNPLSLRQELRRMFTDREFLLLLLGFGGNIGATWALLTVMAQFMLPCGYSETVVGNAGAILLGTGVVGGLALGPLLQRWRWYAAFQKSIGILNVASIVFVLASNTPERETQIVAAYAILGLSSMPIIPLSLEHAAEIVYPASADVAAAALLAAANTIAFCLTLVLTPILEMPASASCSTPVTPAASVVFFIVLASSVAWLPLRARYRRLAAEGATQLATISSASSASAGGVV